VQAHPEWILQDQFGNLLYINYHCSGGTCTHWAFDFANPDFRAYQINLLSQFLNTGYPAIWLDNVDMTVQTSNGLGITVYPVDSNTGLVMTTEVWESYIAAFTTQIRQAFPTAQIIHNAVWFAGSPPIGSDPYVQQEILAADFINLERGFGDTNLVAGPGWFGMNNFLTFIDYVHSLSRKVVIEDYNFDGDFGLAGYYLISSGLDGFANDAVTPDTWWAGYDYELGSPRGVRYDWQGVYRRDYSNGVVLLNPYEADTVTLAPVGTFINTSGTPTSSVTLAGGQGAVLIGAPGWFSRSAGGLRSAQEQR
jgi:hypothetical protein